MRRTKKYGRKTREGKEKANKPSWGATKNEAKFQNKRSRSQASKSATKDLNLRGGSGEVEWRKTGKRKTAEN